MFFVSLCFFLSALVIAFLSPREQQRKSTDKVVKLAAFALLTEGLALLAVAAEGYLDFLPSVELRLMRALALASGVHIALAYHFYAAFFEDLVDLKPRRHTIILFYLWGSFSGAAFQFSLGLFRSPEVLSHHVFLTFAKNAAIGFYLLGLLWIVLLIFRGLRQSKPSTEFTRVKWIVLGSLTGILPYVLFCAVAYSLPLLSLGPVFMSNFFRVSIFCSLAIPFCLAYAIKKHHVFEIHVALQHGLQRSLLSRLLYFAISLNSISIVISYRASINPTVSRVVLENVAPILLTCTLTSLFIFSGKLEQWLANTYGYTTEHTPFILQCQHPGCGLCLDHSKCTRAGHIEPPKRIVGFPRLVDNRYRLEQLIGEGGMGRVFRAVDTRIEKVVAVKIIKRSDDGTDYRELVRKVLDESRILGRLSHPNIVSVTDAGRVEKSTAYLVMELLTGPGLKARVNKNSVSPLLVSIWFEQILNALSAAHRKNIIHRDLKPANIMLHAADGADPIIKLLDFGIAKLLRSDKGNLEATRIGSFKGTEMYASPEQFEGKEVDTRTDIFSVGILLLEVLTGEVPFQSLATYARYAALQERAGLPVKANSDLNRLIRACLAVNPNERPESAEKLSQELVPLIREYKPPTDEARASFTVGQN